ncbi:hypothetical protein JRQ81_014499 [Phrynocephalus forsythii]|uniref:Transglutaminase N-terminal domain-containing protein n=1 Tax=Phrynocephalus forsythii TaxID=171643 RepID=A0A9Q0XWT2_9SAUR|nr:hypothetical protein JRQ81_014499 [Phrynocephalus forsythii]
MGQALPTVKRCDFQAAKNNQAHHTAAISTQRLMVRRGQPFALTLHFCAPLPGGGSLRELRRTSLVAQTGQRPSQAKGTLVQIPISRLGSRTGWEAALEARDALSWSLVVTPPPDATIGHYALLWRHVATTGQATQHPLGSFTLLFNPWCRGDSVFLPNEAQRQEYVLNQDGTIYWGLEEAPQEQPWDFGQLSEATVDLSLVLLEMASLLGSWERGSPLSACRLLHALLSSEAHGRRSPPGEAALDRGAQGRGAPFPVARQRPPPAPVAGHPTLARPLRAGLGDCGGRVLSSEEPGRPDAGGHLLLGSPRGGRQPVRARAL